MYDIYQQSALGVKKCKVNINSQSTQSYIKTPEIQWFSAQYLVLLLHFFITCGTIIEC